MNQPAQSKPDLLVEQAASGDQDARLRLLALYRPRLRQMVAVRLDPALSPRIDPSDVVQDTLATAHQRLGDYLKERPLPFYAWLRQIAWNRLVDLHRQHVTSERRSVSREQTYDPSLSNDSVALLADRLEASIGTPSQEILRDELHQRIKEAMNQLRATEREILVLRHLEELSVQPRIARHGRED